MTTITPYYRTVQQLLQNQSYAIDEYQREYTWEKRNVDELLAKRAFAVVDAVEADFRGRDRCTVGVDGSAGAGDL